MPFVILTIRKQSNDPYMLFAYSIILLYNTLMLIALCQLFTQLFLLLSNDLVARLTMILFYINSMIIFYYPCIRDFRLSKLYR